MCIKKNRQWISSRIRSPRNRTFSNRPRKPAVRPLILAASVLLLAAACATTPRPNADYVKSDAVLKRDIGEASMMQGDFTTALKELLEAEKLDPKDPVTQNYLGITYRNKKQTEKAILHFKKAVDLKPDYSQARNNLGAAYMDNGQWDEAIACFKELTDDLLYTTPHFPLANLGWAYYNKKEYTMAETYFLKAVEVQPNFIIALNGLGQTSMAVGQYGQAVEWFEKAARFGPRIPQVHFQLGKAYEMVGKYEQAAQSYSRVIEIAPDSDLAKAAAAARDGAPAGK